MKTIAVALAVVVLTAQISHAAPKAINTSLPEWAVSLVRTVPFLSSYFAASFENDSRSATASRQHAAKKQSLAPVSGYRGDSAAKIAQIQAIGVPLAKERASMATVALKAETQSVQLESQRR